MHPHPSLRFQAHLAFSQGLPSDQKCQKSLQALPTPMLGQKDSTSKIKDRLTNDKNGQLPTCGHTQLPGREVAIVGSFGYLSGNTTSERPETATAYTAVR
jgi:hypothetical protein